jgi:hypothetical protein
VSERCKYCGSAEPQVARFGAVVDEVCGLWSVRRRVVRVNMGWSAWQVFKEELGRSTTVIGNEATVLVPVGTVQVRLDGSLHHESVRYELKEGTNG